MTNVWHPAVKRLPWDIGGPRSGLSVSASWTRPRVACTCPQHPCLFVLSPNPGRPIQHISLGFLKITSEWDLRWCIVGGWDALKPGLPTIVRDHLQTYSINAATFTTSFNHYVVTKYRGYGLYQHWLVTETSRSNCRCSSSNTYTPVYSYHYIS